MFRALADYINGGFTNLFVGQTPKFPHKYHVEETTDGERRLMVEFDHGIVEFSQKKRFKADVVTFISDNLPEHEVLGKLNERGVDEFYNFWELYTDPIKDVPAFRFWSDPGLCFSRMPFDPISDDGSRCAKFKEICSRIVCNAEQFRAFIGSIFVPESDRQQYLWIKGEGQDGKGCTIRFLHKCLGPAAMNTEVPSQNDMFWNAILPGKRLILFPDCSQVDFPASPKFKMISGGDAIPIRDMRRVQYLSKIECKFMFASNIFPEITGQKSDQRRAIICELEDSNAAMISTYEDEMWLEEAPYIIGWCMDEYKKMCPNNEHIEVDKEIGKALASCYEADVGAVFNEYFKLDPDGFVSSQEMDRVFQREFKRDAGTKLTKFRKWIKSYHGINPGEKKGRTRGYKGLAFRDSNGKLTDRT